MNFRSLDCMPTSSTLLRCLVFATLAAVAVGAAFGRIPEENFRVTRLEQSVRFADDATTITETLLEREALTPSGAQAIGKYSQFVNRELENLEVLEAYTLKPDGTRIPMPPAGMLTQRGITSQANGGLSWPKSEVQFFNFKEVQPGDRTVVHLRRRQHTPALPGWSSHFEILPSSVDFALFRMRIEAPSALQLQVIVHDMAVTPSERDGLQTWTATASTRAMAPSADTSLPEPPQPRVLISTFSSHAQLAQAYATQAIPKARITPAVQALASQITQDHTGIVERSRAIHQWVRKHIQYGAMYLGVGGWVPRDVEEILRTRDGDCKDYTLLMQTLLAAVGIEAVPALVHSGHAFTLPELPVAAGFNHVMLYLPALQLFVDPTSVDIPFGALPWTASDKPAAVALAEGARIIRTPSFKPEDNRQATSTALQVNAAGAAQTVTRITTRGQTAIRMHDYLSRIPAGMEVYVVQGLLQQQGTPGTGRIRYAALQHERLTQDLTAEASIPHLLNNQQGDLLAMAPVVPLPFSILEQMEDHTEPSRAVDTLCVPISLRDDFELELDPAFRLGNLPDNVRETHPDGIVFEAQYTWSAPTFRGRRELTLSHQRHTCSPADYASRRPVMNRIVQHLRRELLVQRYEDP